MEYELAGEGHNLPLPKAHSIPVSHRTALTEKE